MIPINDLHVLGVSALGSVLNTVTKISKGKPLTRVAVNKNTLEYPIFMSDDISDDRGMEIAKALEIKVAYHIKSIFESMVYYNQIKGFSLDNIKKSTGMDVDKEAMLDLYEYIESESDSSIFNETISSDADIKISAKIEMVESVSGIEILDARNAYATTIKVEVKTMVGTKLEIIPYTLEVKCPIKKITYPVLASILISPSKESDKAISRDNKMSFAKVLSSFKMLKGNKKKIATRSSALRGIINKLNAKSKGPYVNFLLTMDFLDYMQETFKYDITNKNTYHSLAAGVPLMSVNLLDLDTNIIKMSLDQNRPNFDAYSLEDLFKDTDAYEKELQSLIKYNQYQ